MVFFFQKIIIILLKKIFIFLVFFYLRGCPGQFACTTTNPTVHWISCKPSEHVRHRGDDRRAQGGSNPDVEEGNKSLPPLGQYLKCFIFLVLLWWVCIHDTSFGALQFKLQSIVSIYVWTFIQHHVNMLYFFFIVRQLINRMPSNCKYCRYMFTLQFIINILYDTCREYNC
jgi:hypothetical protein